MKTRPCAGRGRVKRKDSSTVEEDIVYRTSGDVMESWDVETARMNRVVDTLVLRMSSNVLKDGVFHFHSVVTEPPTVFEAKTKKRVIVPSPSSNVSPAVVLITRMYVMVAVTVLITVMSGHALIWLRMEFISGAVTNGYLCATKTPHGQTPILMSSVKSWASPSHKNHPDMETLPIIWRNCPKKSPDWPICIIDLISI
uniref:Uncharacterized protein n=1 Tax=Cacopsylla melanoneura TaxID=428564 RepID=A0A8D8U7Z2_9HEMI